MNIAAAKIYIAVKVPKIMRIEKLRTRSNFEIYMYVIDKLRLKVAQFRIL